MSKVPKTRWIILPPSSDRKLWLDAIKDAAAKAGLKLTTNAKALSDMDLAVVEDLDLALKQGATPESLAVLLSQAGPLALDKAGLEANTGRHTPVAKASELMRRALTVPAQRRFTARQLAEGRAKLFDDFSLTITGATATDTTPRNLALNRAFEIYAGDEATWPVAVLDLYATVKDRTPSSVLIDATGKPRFMAHGPYISMPPGRWQMVIRIEFESALCGKTYRLNWGGLDKYSEFDFSPEKPGLYQIEMDWTWDTPAPAEFRLINLEGIFDGDFVLHDLQIRRLD